GWQFDHLLFLSGSGALERTAAQLFCLPGPGTSSAAELYATDFRVPAVSATATMSESKVTASAYRANPLASALIRCSEARREVWDTRCATTSAMQRRAL